MALQYPTIKSCLLPAYLRRHPSLRAFEVCLATGLHTRVGRVPPDNMRLRYGGLEHARNAWAFVATCQTGAKYKYPWYSEETHYTGSFVEWHNKRYAAIRSAALNSPEQGGTDISPNIIFSKIKCSRENIFTFLEGKKWEWKIRVRLDGTDVSPNIIFY